MVNWRQVSILWGIVGLLAGSVYALSEEGQLTLEDLYSPDPEIRIDWSGRVPRLRWLGDTHYLERGADGDDEGSWFKVEARSGNKEPYLTTQQLSQALAQVAGIDSDTAAAMVAGELSWSDDFRRLLIAHQNDVFTYDLQQSRASRLTFGPERELEEELSPDGEWLSFVRDHNLFVVEVASGRERRLTTEGSDDLLIGRLDWVYQEEIYGRGTWKAYWWSPDSKHVAFLALDQTSVPDFTVVDPVPRALRTEVTRYPQPGAPNAEARLGVVSVAGGDPVWIDLSRYEPAAPLIVRVGWSPDSTRVMVQVQDREQTWLDLLSADPQNGKAEKLLRETTEASVEVIDEPHWLGDGSFLWLSERTGYRHLYHYEGNGTLRAQLTAGEWEVRDLAGTDAEEKWAYLTSNEADPIGAQVYRVSLAAPHGREQLSERTGTHGITLSPDGTLYLDRWSNLETPTQLLLFGSTEGQIRVVEENEIEELKKVRWGEVARQKVPTGDGFTMEALWILPPDFDSSKRYPVLQYNYGGPHSPVVRDRWGGVTYLWHQYLAQQGYVIWMCDNRSASGKGMKPAWRAYQRLGEVELGDIEAGLKWLQQQPWVDSERLGIWGWSYGGFMASYALTHSKSFKVGIAGGSVTDWRLYDSIYTERYMRMPQNNPDGYERTSVLEAAENLEGRLLLIHGLIDDNVHWQNTAKLVHALQMAGKDFELMVYPQARHGVTDRHQLYHLRRLMTRFIVDNL